MNFSLNFSPDALSFREVCELNQIQMMNQLERLPIGLFIFITLALAGLVAHLYIVPRLNAVWRERLVDAFPLFSLGCLVWAWLIALGLSFRISEAAWNVAGTVATIALGLLVAWLLWRMRRRGARLDVDGGEAKSI